MLEEFLETSKAYNTKINDLRIQAATFCIYNLLMTYVSLFSDDLSWDFSLAEGNYANQLGIALTAPTFTSKFNLLSGSLNFFFSLCIIMPIVIPTPEFRNYLLPSIIWNIYTVTAHCNNILELTYDLFTLSGHPSVAFNLFLTGSFTASLHILLLMETILFYDRLNYVPKDNADFTIWEIEENFRGSSTCLRDNTTIKNSPMGFSAGGDAF